MLDLNHLNTLRTELLTRVKPAPRSARALILIDQNMRTTSGTANFKTNTIKLNARLLTANPHHILQTFAHELAHLVVYELHGLKDGAGHGAAWQGIMRAFGLEPYRCHRLDVSAFKRKQKTFAVFCNCRTHTFKTGRYNKLKRGHRFQCLKCNSLVRLTKEA